LEKPMPIDKTKGTVTGPVVTPTSRWWGGGGVDNEPQGGAVK
jgi:hypothetical protein